MYVGGRVHDALENHMYVCIYTDRYAYVHTHTHTHTHALCGRVHDALENPFDQSGLDDIWLAMDNELRRVHFGQAQYPGGTRKNRKMKII